MTIRRVGVNLAWLVPGVVGGSEEATTRALRAVGDAAGAAGIELVLFGLPSLAEAHGDLTERFEFHALDVAGRNKVRRVLAETTQLPAMIAAARVDLVHHAGGVVPFRSTGTVTLAIHDTQPLDLPANFSPLKRRYLATMIPRSLRRAAGVTVPSGFVRERVVALGAPPDRVSVVPWSVPEPVEMRRDERSSVLRRHGIDRPYVLYPAIAYPHKNHAVLLDAMAELRSRRSAAGLEPVQLVLTGAAGPLDDELAARSARPDLAGSVTVLGRVPEPDLRALVAEAAVVAVPSRYEGFGLPALEALAAGRPAVVADAGSLPEVVAGAALVVGPDDVPGWATALGSALTDEAERTRLVAAGLAVAASCSPQRTATALLDVWRRCLDGAASPRPDRNPS